MKSIFLTIGVAVLFSFVCAGADNYSQWPRRPAELEQSRRLIREGKSAEAMQLLRPFLTESGIAGREARQIVGRVNVVRYLSRRHPKARVYTVKRGDTMARIARSCGCPEDVVMLINGMVEPSSIRTGQRIVVIPMELRMDIHPEQREVSIWDGSELVADYHLLSVPPSLPDACAETAVKERCGFLNGRKIAPGSPMLASGDRELVLQNGWRIVGDRGEGAASRDAFRMEQRDVNEIALLMGVGAPVSVRGGAPASSSEGENPPS